MTLRPPDFDNEDSVPVAKSDLIQALTDVASAGDDVTIAQVFDLVDSNPNSTFDMAEQFSAGEYEQASKRVTGRDDFETFQMDLAHDKAEQEKDKEDSIIKKAKFFAVMDYYVRALAKQAEELKKVADDYEQELLEDERYDIDIAKITINVLPDDITEMAFFLDSHLADKRLTVVDQMPKRISMSRTQTWVGNIIVAQQPEAFETIRHLARIEEEKMLAGDEVTDLDRLTGEDARAWLEQIREYIFPQSMKTRIKSTVETIKQSPKVFVEKYLNELKAEGAFNEQVEMEYLSLINDPEMITEKQMRNLLPDHLKPYLTVLLKPTITARKG